MPFMPYRLDVPSRQVHLAARPNLGRSPGDADVAARTKKNFLPGQNHVLFVPYPAGGEKKKKFLDSYWSVDGQGLSIYRPWNR